MPLSFNDALEKIEIDPHMVIAMRHRPTEAALRKILPWLLQERPDLYNAYQQTQGAKVETAMKKLIGNGYIASFIGQNPGTAHFAGLYRIGETKPLTRKQYWEISAYIEMKQYGIEGFKESDPRDQILWFDLQRDNGLSEWISRLIVSWPPPERSWWRRAHRNDLKILELKQSNAVFDAVPAWDEVCLSWQELKVLPANWKIAFSQWRGIYYIYDKKTNLGYVGSAYGNDNLYGRWECYATTGHGGNKYLRKLDPKGFQFSILQRVSPDMSSEEVIAIESSWKQRLHSQYPNGLNDN